MKTILLIGLMAVAPATWAEEFFDYPQNRKACRTLSVMKRIKMPPTKPRPGKKPATEPRLPGRPPGDRK